MPINLDNYIDTPGAPRRAVYSDFTIGYGGVLGLDAGLTFDIGHGCALGLVFPAGLINWEIVDKPIISWHIYALGVAAAASPGSLLIRIGGIAAALANWRVYALNTGHNVMEGLYIPAPVCAFRLISSANNAGYAWHINARGV